jgi:hypothetical protein
VATPFTDMASGNALEVPIFWLRAEKTAEDLIMASEGVASPATFEYRTTRDVLALTIFLVDLDQWSTEVPIGHLKLIRDHLAIPPQWLEWSRSRLHRADYYNYHHPPRLHPFGFTVSGGSGRRRSVVTVRNRSRSSGGQPRIRSLQETLSQPDGRGPPSVDADPHRLGPAAGVDGNVIGGAE